MIMPLDYLIFDPTACGFPKPRIPPLPDGLAGLRAQAQTASVAPASFFRNYTRGRYALRDAYQLAGIGSGSALLAPSYHCRTMIDPALALGGDVLLYPLRQDLTPDLGALDILLDRSSTPVNALLATHFFGMPQRMEALTAWCRKHGILLIEDCSHVLFCEGYRAPNTGLHGDFVISSPYKFLPSPDGGLLYTTQAHRLDELEARHPALTAELRGLVGTFTQAWQHYLLAKTCDRSQIDAELAACAERCAAPGSDSRQDENRSADYRSVEEGLASLRFSRLIWRHADIGEIARRRRENYLRWADALAGIPHCRPLFSQLPEGCIPYMLPLHIDRPDLHFYWLKHLGVPIWRWDSIAVSDCPTANNYRLHLLHLPCHQSLTETELEWMVEAVAKVMGRAVPGAN